MVQTCPEGFDWGVWSDTINFFSPCFFNVTLYICFCTIFWGAGGFYLHKLNSQDRNRLSLLPRKTSAQLLKIILVWLIMFLRAIDLITLVANETSHYMEIHDCAEILSWGLSGVILMAERSHDIIAHHWCVRYFWGMSFFLQTLALREVIVMKEMDYIHEGRVVLYIIFATLNFALCVLAIIIKPKRSNDDRQYSSIVMDEPNAGNSEGKECFVVEKKARHEIKKEEEDTKSDDVTWDLVKRILYFGRPEVCMLMTAALMKIVGSILGMVKNLVYGLLMNALLDSATQADAMEAIDQYVELMMLSYGFECIMGAASLAIFGLSGERIATRLRNTVYSCILTQDIAFFDSTPTGELLNRIVQDTGILTGVIMNNMSSWITPIIQGVVSFIAIFLFSWKLTMVTLALVPASLSALYISGKVSQMLTQKDLDALAKANATSEEGISNIRTIRSFGTEAFEEAKYEKDLYVSYDISILKYWIGGFIGQYQSLLGQAMGVIGFWYGGSLVVQGKFKLGFLMSYFMFQGTAISSLHALIGIFPKLAAGVGASKRIFQMLDRERSVRFCGGERLRDPKGHIVFSNVCFAYPSKPQLVLQGLNLEVLPGEQHALVGASGGGKSTIINLVNAFYTISAGQLTFDGHNISELDPLWYRRLLGYVAQEPILFNTSIRNNISYGTIASEEQIMEAARKAYTLDFILDREKCPHEFNTNVGVRGGTLSGGQKQRIAIARALLRNPQVLLLDEATSALDSESEKMVQDALDQLMGSRTCIVVAHRLSTVRRSKCIHVIQKGTTVESGSHEQLLEKNGAYAELAKRQFNLGKDKDSTHGTQNSPPNFMGLTQAQAQVDQQIQALAQQANQELPHLPPAAQQFVKTLWDTMSRQVIISNGYKELLQQK